MDMPTNMGLQKDTAYFFQQQEEVAETSQKQTLWPLVRK
jgi:hypothetical protein